MNRIDERLMLFQELMSCINNLYIWKYDAQMNLLSSNCPDESTLHMVFSLENLSGHILEYASENQMPFVFSNSIDMSWIILFEKENQELLYVYLLGPAFTDASAIARKEQALSKISLTALVKHNFLNLIETLPVIGISQYLQYATMMHYCITREKISFSDFFYYEASKKNTDNNRLSNIHADDISDRHSSYLFEQRFLKMVEEGNLSYITEGSKSSYTGTVGKMSIMDSLRQTKNMIIASIVLCTRAAIKGGLAPEIAYMLSDKYILDIEACQSTAEVVPINQMMQRDFIQRVYKIRTESSVSAFAKMCCDYIDLHIEDDISLSDLAKRTGYTEHYLGKRFKKEMNISLKQYINKERIEYAKLLLSNTTQSITDISEHLHFCSASYFTKLFHDITALTPAEYREKAKYIPE